MPTKKKIKEINSRKKPTKGFSDESLRRSAAKAVNTINRNKVASDLNVTKHYGLISDWDVTTTASSSESYHIFCYTVDNFRNKKKPDEHLPAQ